MAVVTHFTLKGKAVRGGAGIEGVRVSDKRYGKEVTTGGDGRFVLRIRTGRHNFVTFEKPGYATRTIEYRKKGRIFYLMGNIEMVVL